MVNTIHVQHFSRSLLNEQGMDIFGKWNFLQLVNGCGCLLPERPKVDNDDFCKSNFLLFFTLIFVNTMTTSVNLISFYFFL